MSYLCFLRLINSTPYIKPLKFNSKTRNHVLNFTPDKDKEIGYDKTKKIIVQDAGFKGNIHVISAGAIGEQKEG